jgi:hypothetical protein
MTRSRLPQAKKLIHRKGAEDAEASRSKHELEDALPRFACESLRPLRSCDSALKTVPGIAELRRQRSGVGTTIVIQPFNW